MTIAQLIAYRRRNERLVEKVEEVDMPTAWGHFRLSMYKSLTTGYEHLALVKGDVSSGEPVLVPIPDGMKIDDLDLDPGEILKQLFATRRNLQRAEARAEALETRLAEALEAAGRISEILRGKE
jgi:3,4-dihydroxy 2-butanone 4-phosphate synthase/GTP cyclohydrolase II